MYWASHACRGLLHGYDTLTNMRDVETLPFIAPTREFPAENELECTTTKSKLERGEGILCTAQQLIWQLFNAVEKGFAASGDTDKAFLVEVQAKRAQMDKGLRIGSWGQLQGF
jgi:hypothetical protein